jgi:glutathione synthase/RimK-type ligase-like ATP-grasp enzyme
VTPIASNGSKPYQAQLIQACGFQVPDSLVTNDPESVREFQAEHGRVIFKSISGERSIVHELDDEFLSRLEHIRWCPVQFQAYVEGLDLRVHVVGEKVFATTVRSDATDYRYAGASGAPLPRLEPARLSDTLADRCVNLSRRLGLAFSGIDLRVTPDEQIVCFEVNPCPGYSYYETHTGQPIARAVAEYLTG